MTVVIVIISIAVGLPTAAVCVPPAVPLSPGTFAGLMQLVAPVVGLPAVPAVTLHGFVEFVVRLENAALAAAVLVCHRTRWSGEGQHANKNRGGGHGLSEKLLLSLLHIHFPSLLPISPHFASVHFPAYTP